MTDAEQVIAAMNMLRKWRIHPQIDSGNVDRILEDFEALQRTALQAERYAPEIELMNTRGVQVFLREDMTTYAFYRAATPRRAMFELTETDMLYLSDCVNMVLEHDDESINLNQALANERVSYEHRIKEKD